MSAHVPAAPGRSPAWILAAMTSVLVVGGGPAGRALAAECVRAGLRDDAGRPRPDGAVAGHVRRLARRPARRSPPACRGRPGAGHRAHDPHPRASVRGLGRPRAARPPRRAPGRVRGARRRGTGGRALRPATSCSPTARSCTPTSSSMRVATAPPCATALRRRAPANAYPAQPARMAAERQGGGPTPCASRRSRMAAPRRGGSTRWATRPPGGASESADGLVPADAAARVGAGGAGWRPSRRLTALWWTRPPPPRSSSPGRRCSWTGARTTARRAGPPSSTPSPSAADAVLLEETSLARRPGLPLPVLRRRLLARLAHHGITPPADAPVERVRFPVDDPRHNAPGVLGFGAAAPLVHPATGFSVADALRLAPAVADALVDRRAAGRATAACGRRAPARCTGCGGSGWRRCCACRPRRSPTSSRPSSPCLTDTADLSLRARRPHRDADDDGRALRPGRRAAALPPRRACLAACRTRPPPSPAANPVAGRVRHPRQATARLRRSGHRPPFGDDVPDAEAMSALGRRAAPTGRGRLSGHRRSRRGT